MQTIYIKIMRISYSAIETYKTCPLKFKYQAIDKIRVPKNKEAIFGSTIHSALKFMFKRDPLYPTLEETIDFFRENFNEQKSKVDWEENEQDIFKNEGIKIIKQFYKKNQPWNYNVLDLESRFQVPIEDPQTKEQHILSGIMDRIDKISDNEFEIIDYKTSKRMPSQDMLDKNLQLAIYNLGFLKCWPDFKNKVIKLSLHFLKHGEKISTTRSPEQLRETQNQIINTINEIEERKKTNDFPATPSALCDWCGYKKMCPMWSHLYEEDPPGDEQIKKIAQEYFSLKKQNQENNLRIKELQTKINKYMEEKEINRVFADDGYLTSSVKTTPIYDMEKVKAILEPLELWEKILKADEAKLKKIIATLPSSAQEELKNAITGEKKTSYLSATRKKIKKEN